MISITSINFDLFGYIMLSPTADTGRITYERRVSKNATLDGLSTISDFGFTASDNTLSIKIKYPTVELTDRIIYLIKNYPLLRYANADGVFIGSLRTLKLNTSPIELVFDIKQQVA